MEGNKIILRNVNFSDSGLYSISCCNDDGEEGEEILELEVLVIKDGPQATGIRSQANRHSVTCSSRSELNLTNTTWRCLGEGTPLTLDGQWGTIMACYMYVYMCVWGGGRGRLAPEVGGHHPLNFGTSTYTRLI